jgi:hypothetical protein
MLKGQRVYEGKWKSVIARYFDELRLRVKQNYNNQKSIQARDLLDEDAEKGLVFDLLTPLQREYIEKEGQRAMNELGLGGVFVVTPEIADALDSYTMKLSGGITQTSINKIKEILIENSEEGISTVAEKIDEFFDYSMGYRAEMIARSETIRSSNWSMVEAWKQTDVVDAKEWYTAQDERVCEFCMEMDERSIELNATFINEGDTMLIEDEDGFVSEMVADYRDIDEPPLHANCRCVLLPVLK